MTRRRTSLPTAPDRTASLYVRLSVAAGTANMSRDGMLDDLRVLADREGLTVVAEHVDDGKSGAIRNRPQFVAWLDDARECRASTLIGWHVDRLTREGINCAALILDATEGKDPETGEVVRSPARLLDNGGLDSAGDSTAFRFNFAIKAEVARAERERMVARTTAMHARARAAGRWTLGQAPYGWRIVQAETGGAILEPDDDEGEIVRESAERLLTEASAASVTRWLNNEGVQTRRGARWSTTTLRQVMLNERTRDILGPAKHAAVARLYGSRVGLRPPGGRPLARLLSGLLTCHSCEHPLAVGMSRTRPVYKCMSRSRGRECLAPVAIDAQQSDDHMQAMFLALYGDVRGLIERVEVQGADDLAAADDEHALALEALRHDATAHNFERLRTAQERIEQLRAAPAQTVRRRIRSGRTVREEWAASPDVADRRAKLSAYVAFIEVGPSGGSFFDPRRLAPEWIAEPDDL